MDNNSQKPKSLVFCETAQHVEQALSDLATGFTTSELVALTPEAAWECQLRGQHYLKIEDFYNEVELSTHAEEVFKDEVEWANWVDTFLQQSIPVFNQANFLAANASFSLLHQFLDGFFESAYALTHFLERVRPHEILYWPWTPTEPPWHLRYEGPHYSALLPMLAPRYGMLLREVITDRTGDAGPILLSNSQQEKQQHLSREWCHFPAERFGEIGREARLLLKSGYIAQEIRLLRSAGLRRYFWSIIRQAIPSGRVLVAGKGYDLESLILALRERGVAVTWLHNVSLTRNSIPKFDKPSASAASLQQDLARFWPTVIQRDEFWAPLVKWGVGRNHRTEIALSFWWHRIIPELWQGYHSASKAVSRRRHLAVVAFEAGGTLCGVILQSARTHSIPRLIYQHGSTARIRIGDFYPYLLHSERFLAYGEGTASHLQRNWPLYLGKQPEVVPVGSARLDALRARMSNSRVKALRAELQRNDHRPIILYVPTIMGVWERTLSDLTGYADVTYFELQERIVRLLAGFPSLRLFYKDMLRVTVWNPIPDLIRREVPNGVVVLSPPLHELVWAVDAIIVDHVVTALSEALLTRKRLVVYDPVLSGCELEPPEARELLRKRATVAESPDEFVEVVRTFLTVSDFSEINEPNDEFIKAYATYLNDGCSVQRAVDEILRAAVPSSARSAETAIRC